MAENASLLWHDRSCILKRLPSADDLSKTLIISAVLISLLADDVLIDTELTAAFTSHFSSLKSVIFQDGEGVKTFY